MLLLDPVPTMFLFSKSLTYIDVYVDLSSKIYKF